MAAARSSDRRLVQVVFPRRWSIGAGNSLHGSVRARTCCSARATPKTSTGTLRANGSGRRPLHQSIGSASLLSASTRRIGHGRANRQHTYSVVSQWVAELHAEVAPLHCRLWRGGCKRRQQLCHTSLKPQKPPFWRLLGDACRASGDVYNVSLKGVSEGHTEIIIWQRVRTHKYTH